MSGNVGGGTTRPPRMPSKKGASSPGDDRRASLIRQIHVGRRQLGWDDATYRAALVGHGGADSCRDMTAQNLRRVLDFMRGMGFRLRPAAIRQDTKMATGPVPSKCRAMWIVLHDIGSVKDASERALVAFARRQTGIDRMEWTRDERPVVEALKAWLLRDLAKWLSQYVPRDPSQWAPASAANVDWANAYQAALRSFYSTSPSVTTVGRTRQLDALMDVYELVKLAVGNEGKA